MKRILAIIILLLTSLGGYSQTAEQVVRGYITALNDFLMSPNNYALRSKLENTLSGCLIQDGIYIKYKGDVNIEDIKARDYVGIISETINKNSEYNYAKVSIVCDLETINGGSQVVAYLEFTGAILMKTVTVFHIKGGRISAMTNDLIKTNEWKRGSSPCASKSQPDPPKPVQQSDNNLVQQQPARQQPTSGSHDYVDLGLPSGTLWATCNVGASSPEDYGDYFAWGETDGKKASYSWFNYKYAKGKFDKLTKYCYNKRYGNHHFTDNLTTLKKIDDVAYQKWGSDWCMPTLAQFQELKDKCTWIWTMLNGKKGYNVKGPNGKSFFLPAAGYKGSDGKTLRDGSAGLYWSSSLSTSEPRDARDLDFASRDVSSRYGSRFLGFSVRPVRCKN